MSGIGQIEPNFGVADGRWTNAEVQAALAGPSPNEDQSAIDNRKSSMKDSIGAARPKVKELRRTFSAGLSAFIDESRLSKNLLDRQHSKVVIRRLACDILIPFRRHEVSGVARAPC
jgi:hypothetical protein